MIILRVDPLVREREMPSASGASVNGPMSAEPDRIMVSFVAELDRIVAAENDRPVAFVGLFFFHPLPLR